MVLELRGKNERVARNDIKPTVSKFRNLCEPVTSEVRSNTPRRVDISHALSRAPFESPQRGDNIGDDADAPSVPSTVGMEVAATKMDIRLTAVRQAVAEDPEMQLLLTIVRQGFPVAKSLTPEPLRQYWPVHDRLSVDDGLVVCDSRLVTPLRLRSTVLEALHASHLGKEKPKARARQIVYWSGIDRGVENITRCCTSSVRGSFPLSTKRP